MSEWIRNLIEDPPEAANFNGADWAEMERRAAVRRALELRREVQTFEARWSEPAPETAAVPGFTWSQLERQLADLAETPVKSAMARELISATRKMARFKPPEMVLREILCLTWALLDEEFQPEPGEGWREDSADMP